MYDECQNNNPQLFSGNEHVMPPFFEFGGIPRIGALSQPQKMKKASKMDEKRPRKYEPNCTCVTTRHHKKYASWMRPRGHDASHSTYLLCPRAAAYVPIPIEYHREANEHDQHLPYACEGKASSYHPLRIACVDKRAYQ
jgi:hypothetical protein